jgi:hypothetical protein
MLFPHLRFYSHIQTRSYTAKRFIRIAMYILLHQRSERSVFLRVPQYSEVRVDAVMSRNSATSGLLCPCTTCDYCTIAFSLRREPSYTIDQGILYKSATISNTCRFSPSNHRYVSFCFKPFLYWVSSVDRRISEEKNA